jgi:serine/threonine protein kinase
MPLDRLAAIAPSLPGMMLPELIGKYRVKAKLGEGSTSEVFLAHDPFHDRDVAIKRVRTGVLADPRELHYQQRFFAAEAALVGRLHHPNVVEILRRRGRRGRALPGDGVRGAASRCAATAAPTACCRWRRSSKSASSAPWRWATASSQGLIHRDVKPANLLVTLDGDQITNVKVTDFGSVFNQGADHTQIYRVGSLAYMSPEQLDGDTLDSRADMYSLAAVLYHLIAGRPPFRRHAAAGDHAPDLPRQPAAAVRCAKACPKRCRR